MTEQELNKEMLLVKEAFEVICDRALSSIEIRNRIRETILNSFKEYDNKDRILLNNFFDTLSHQMEYLLDDEPEEE